MTRRLLAGLLFVLGSAAARADVAVLVHGYLGTAHSWDTSGVNAAQIDAAEINTFPLGPDAEGELIVVKPGKYGPYVKRGDDTASVPDDLAPDELTVEKAIELLAAPKSDEPIGELDGYPVYAKNGRYGPYVQWGDHDNPPPGATLQLGFKPDAVHWFDAATGARVDA